MITVKKLTPLAFGYRVTSRRAKDPELAIIVRAKLRLTPNAPLELVRADLERFSDGGVVGEEARRALDEAALNVGQGSLTADRFEEGDDERAGQVVYPGDFAEWKPRTDVMMRGTCYAPGGAAETCNVGFGLVDAMKQLRVVGPRVWVDKVLGGKHTDPLLFDKIPVDYRNAFGGPAFPDNPVGVGHEGERLPGIEDPKRSSPRDQTPVGFGPINPAWPARQRKLGKEYGEAYERTRAPWYAVDYDWTAQNAAPEDQQVKGYLRGDEALRFINLHPTARDFTVRLPGLAPRAFVLLDTTKDDEGVEVALSLDTVFADLDEGLLYVTWRGLTPVREDDLSDVKFLLLAHETLGGERHEAPHYRAILRDFARDPYGLAANPANELAALEARLESGDLDKELDALGEGEDPISKIFGPLAAKAPGGDALIAQMKEGLARMGKATTGAGDAVKAMLKEALGVAFAGSSGPRLAFTSKGELALRPFLKRMMRDIAGATTRGGQAMDPADVQSLVQRELSRLDLPGVDAADLELPESLDPPEPAPGADFSGCDLVGLDLGGRDLSGACFDGAVLRGVNLRGASLVGATMIGATLTACSLEGADLSGVDLTQAFVTRCGLAKAKLEGARLDQATLQRCDLEDASLTRVSALMMTIERSKLARVTAEGATFAKCIFNQCTAKGALFARASLARSFFRECDLDGASFERSDVSGCGFFASSLDEASFLAARGEGTNFQASSIARASFRHADMPASLFLTAPGRGADFTAADMPGSRFYRAALIDARFDRANLRDADMRKAALDDASFREASCYQASFVDAAGNVDFRGANLVRARMKGDKLVKK